MRFLTIPVRNLRQRRIRTALTVGGIAVAVASFTALITVSRGVGDAWSKCLDERGTHLVAVSRDSVEVLTAAFDQDTTAQLAAVDGVAEVSGELADLINVDGKHAAFAVGWDRGCYLWRDWRLREGSKPDVQTSNGVILGASSADALGKGVGDTVSVRGRDFVISGISQYSGSINGGALILQLSALQEMMGRPGKVTGFQLRVRDADKAGQVGAVKERLAKDFPDMVFHETEELAQNNQLLGVMRAAAWSNSTIALMMGLIVVLNTLAMSVMERRFEFGVLSAVGRSKRRVLAMIMVEGLILAVLGSVLGGLGGVGFSYWLAAMPQARGFLDITVTPRLLAEVSAAAVALGVAGSAYPAWRALRQDPVEALRHE